MCWRPIATRFGEFFEEDYFSIDYCCNFNLLSFVTNAATHSEFRYTE